MKKHKALEEKKMYIWRKCERFIGVA